MKDAILPEWWEKGMGKTQAGYEMTIGILATRLGLTHESLRDEQSEPLFRDDAPVRFKLKNGTVSHEVSASQTFAVQVARLVLKGATSDTLVEVESASDVRERILSAGLPWIDLRALLEWSWSVGIPVIHVDCRKIKGRTMEAMAVRVDGRYAIVLSLNHKSPARLLFHLAHELGHIILGHLEQDGVIADEGIADGAEGDMTGQDTQELEANAFAVELLTGSAKKVYKLGAKSKTETLIKKAVEKGEKDRVLPASVVMLNTQYLREEMPHIKPWGRASKALRVLETGRPAREEINSTLCSRMRWSSLTEDQTEFLEELLQIDSEITIQTCRFSSTLTSFWSWQVWICYQTCARHLE
ncbi:MAG: ImmA/IrrE family metallo-endopeptidase [Bacteroidota bacterium]